MIGLTYFDDMPGSPRKSCARSYRQKLDNILLTTVSAKIIATAHGACYYFSSLPAFRIFRSPEVERDFRYDTRLPHIFVVDCPRHLRDTAKTYTRRSTLIDILKTLAYFSLPHFSSMRFDRPGE